MGRCVEGRSASAGLFSATRVLVLALSPVLVAAAISAQILITGGRFVGAARRKVFTAEFFRKAKESGLLEEHKKATGTDKVATGGYPDMGSGRYGT